MPTTEPRQPGTIRLFTLFQDKNPGIGGTRLPACSDLGSIQISLNMKEKVIGGHRLITQMMLLMET